jgi:ketosteroid isomerase-like protein
MQESEWAEILAFVDRPEPPRKTLEERVALLEDRERIRSLIVEYAINSDAHRRDKVFDQYADDIERILAGTLDQIVKGKAALRRAAERSEYRRRSGAPTPSPEWMRSLETTHFVTNELIRVSDDGRQAYAVARALVLVKRELDGVHHRGFHETLYAFTFRKSDGREWRFVRQFVVSGHGHNQMFDGPDALRRGDADPRQSP